MNVVKHAEASHADVRLVTVDERLVVSVRDDGVGFVPDDRATGFGLFSVRERLRGAGGTLFIESVSGKGTEIVLEVPLTPTS